MNSRRQRPVQTCPDQFELAVRLRIIPFGAALLDRSFRVEAYRRDGPIRHWNHSSDARTRCEGGGAQVQSCRDRYDRGWSLFTPGVVGFSVGQS